MIYRITSFKTVYALILRNPVNPKKNRQDYIIQNRFALILPALLYRVNPEKSCLHCCIVLIL